MIIASSGSYELALHMRTRRTPKDSGLHRVTNNSESRQTTWILKEIHRIYALQCTCVTVL